MSESTNPQVGTVCERAETLGALTLLAFLLPGTPPAQAYEVARALQHDRLCLHSGGAFTWYLAFGPTHLPGGEVVLGNKVASLNLSLGHSASDEWLVSNR